MICSQFDVIDIPFPFSDLPRSKQRKALVLSDENFHRQNGASVLMMITSASHSAWHLDIELDGWQQAGLRKPCVARLKLFTLDNGLIMGKVGELTERDRKGVANALQQALPLSTQ